MCLFDHHCKFSVLCACSLLIDWLIDWFGNGNEFWNRVRKELFLLHADTHVWIGTLYTLVYGYVWNTLCLYDCRFHGCNRFVRCYRSYWSIPYVFVSVYIRQVTPATKINQLINLLPSPSQCNRESIDWNYVSFSKQVAHNLWTDVLLTFLHDVAFNRS